MFLKKIRSKKDVSIQDLKQDRCLSKIKNRLDVSIQDNKIDVSIEDLKQNGYFYTKSEMSSFFC